MGSFPHKNGVELSAYTVLILFSVRYLFQVPAIEAGSVNCFGDLSVAQKITRSLHVADFGEVEGGQGLRNPMLVHRVLILE